MTLEEKALDPTARVLAPTRPVADRNAWAGYADRTPPRLGRDAWAAWRRAAERIRLARGASPRLRGDRGLERRPGRP